MGDFTGIFGMIIFFGGLYCLYAAYTMKKTGEINKNVLLGSGKDPNHCKDKKAYIQEATPKVLIFGVIAVLDGAIDYTNTSIVNLGIVAWISMGIFTLALVWYFVVVYKMNRKYFD